MKQALIIIVVLSFIGILLSGGFTIRDPKRLLSSSEATQLVPPSNNPDAKATLQLLNQIAVSPSPKASVQPSASPSETTNTCSSKVAIDFLLDVSSSMNEGSPQSKINSLKTALVNFGSKLTSNNVVGVQVFSSPFGDSQSNPSVCYSLGQPSAAACEILPISNFNGATFQQKIDLLHGSGQTNMKSAFQFVKPILDAGMNNSAYADYEWYLVFLSDGKPVPPESQWPFRAGNLQPVDAVTPIKGEPKLTILSIGLGRPGDDYDQGLMTQIASGPQYFHGSLTGNDLETTFQTIFNQTCTTTP